jgi:hypothetical protein
MLTLILGTWEHPTPVVYLFYNSKKREYVFEGSKVVSFRELGIRDLNSFGCVQISSLGSWCLVPIYMQYPIDETLPMIN